MKTETINFGDTFVIHFSDMKIEVEALGLAKDFINFKTDIIGIDNTLDDEMFELDYDFNIYANINASYELPSSAVSAYAKVLTEAKKLMSFMEDNKINFIEKVTAYETSL